MVTKQNINMIKNAKYRMHENVVLLSSFRAKLLLTKLL